MRRNRWGLGRVRWRLLVCLTLIAAAGNALAATQADASGPVSISMATSVTATIGQAFSDQVTLSGGSGSYNVDYSSPNQPLWLYLPTVTGDSFAIAGTPTPGTASIDPGGIGTFTVTVIASDAANSSDTASATVTITVLGRTVIGVTEPSGGIPVTGQSPGTYSAHISSPDVADSPEGTVTFAITPAAGPNGPKDGSTTDIPGCVDVTLIGDSNASCQLPGEDVGWYEITTTYNPAAGDWYSSNSNTDEPYEVNQASTITTVSQNTSGSQITATVTPQSPGAGAPTGNVQFYEGSGQSLGSGTLVPDGSYSTVTLTVSNAFVAGSSNPVRVDYFGDTNFLPSEATSTVTIPPIAIAPTTLSNDTYGTPYSQQLDATGGAGSYSFAVASGSSLPDGMTLSPSGLLSGSPMQAGLFDFTVTATDFQGGTGSQSLSLDVLAPSTITTSTDPAGPVTGQPLTLTAGVSSADTSATATGTLSFERSDGSAISGCTGLTLAGGDASCQLSGTDAGAYPVKLVYSGDDTFAPLTTSGSYTVDRAGTVTSVSGTSSGFTATVTAASPGAGAPSGSVDFYEGSTPVGSGTLSGGTPDTASLTLATPLPAGSDTAITAKYQGDTDFMASQASSSVSVTPLTIAPATLPGGTDGIAYSRQLTASGGAGSPTYSFAITSGSLPAGLSISRSGLISGTPTRAGTSSFTLSAGDTAGDTGTQSYQLTVSLPSVTTALSLSSSPSDPVYGQTLTLTATVTNPLSGFTPSGTVTFEDAGGGTISGCGSVTLDAGTAVCTVTAATVGTHAVSAAYTGDDVYSPVSASGHYSVAQAQTGTAIAADGSTLRATVTVVTPGAGTPTGTVDFMVAGQSVGDVSLSSGTATLAYPVPAGQSRAVTAVYSGDADFAGSSASATDSGGSTTDVGGTSPTGGGSSSAGGTSPTGGGSSRTGGGSSRTGGGSSPTGGGSKTTNRRLTITAALHSLTVRNRYGWYSHPVRVVFTCRTHGARLISPCPKPVMFDHSRGGQSVRRTIKATDGRTATVLVKGVNVDLTSPELRLEGLRSGVVYDAAPAPRCVVHDSVSGIAGCTLELVKTTATTGPELTTLRYTATATSRAGERSTSTVTVQRLGIYLVGARYVDGRFLVRPGASYRIDVTSGAQPRYIDASPTPNQPGGDDKWFAQTGPQAWSQVVTLPSDLFSSFGTWQLGIEIGDRLHSIPVAAAG